MGRYCRKCLAKRGIRKKYKNGGMAILGEVVYRRGVQTFCTLWYCAIKAYRNLRISEKVF